MDEQKIELLVVDDEEFNRDILEEYLTAGGYAVTLAEDGEATWDVLNSGSHNFSAVLLDRMMPRLDGMGLLKRIKSVSRFEHIPVVFQTALDNPSDIVEGMNAGAFYYLTKPVDKDMLLAIVQSAVSVRVLSTSRHEELSKERRQFFALMRRGEFQLCTLEEARGLANTLASFYPDPARVLLGLSELLINAVEHGNLGISYTEKSRLLQEARWEEEIKHRLALPESAGKVVNVQLEHLSGEIRVTITDCGTGFDWNKYLEMSPERAFDPNGRGIAMSRMMSFDALEYMGKGNQVTAVVRV